MSNWAGDSDPTRQSSSSQSSEIQLSPRHWPRVSLAAVILVAVVSALAGFKAGSLFGVSSELGSQPRPVPAISHAPGTKTTPVACPTWNGEFSNDPKQYYTHHEEYQCQPSYVGQLGANHLKQGATYWMPDDVYLFHTGDDRWYIRDLEAPVLQAKSDAGPNPYQLDVITEPKAYMFEGGEGLRITLPPHATIDRPGYDIRDPAFRHLPVVPINSVVPARGRKLTDYYSNDRIPSLLPVGQSRLIPLNDVKFVRGTGTAYISNNWYLKPGESLGPDTFVRFTRTSSGFTACPNVPERKGSPVFVVPATYQPLPSDIKARISC